MKAQEKPGEQQQAMVCWLEDGQLVSGSPQDAGYPYRQCSSGIPEKFIPYQPAISDKGRKIVVTIVKICIMRF